MTASAFKSPASLGRFFLTAAAGISLDLWVKWIAFHKLAAQILTLPDGHVEVQPLRIVRFIPGWLEFEVTANQGAVFGSGQGHRDLFLVVSVIAMIFLCYLFSQSGRRWVFQILLGILLAGVVGNFYDRLRFGYVRDMIHALPGKYWPLWVQHRLTFLPPELFPWIFNIADSLLCVGVALMLLYSFFAQENAREATPADPREPSPAPPADARSLQADRR